MRERTITHSIVEALRGLGGTAHLKDIYAKVRQLGHDDGGRDEEVLNKSIRKRLCEHSSDSPQFFGNPNDDLFHTPELGTGVWELREDFANDLEEAVDPPMRKDARINRIIRDNPLIRELKAMHMNCCQMCGIFIAVSDGHRYSEGHHLQPLGRPHNGPDIRSNILILCPNDHARCDLGAITLDLAQLHCHEQHEVDPKFIRYHNERIARSNARCDSDADEEIKEKR